MATGLQTLHVCYYIHLCMATGLQTLHVCYYIQPPLYGHWSTDVTCMLLYTTTSVWALVYRRYMYVIIYNHLCMATGLQTLHVCYYIQPSLYGHWSTDVTCMLLYTTTSVWPLVYRRYMYVIIYNHLCMATGLQTLHVCYYIQPPLYGHWSTDVTCMLLYTPLYGHWSTDVTCMLLYTTTSVWPLVYRRYMYVIIYNHLCMVTGLQTLHVCYYIQPPLYGHWSTDVTCMLLYTPLYGHWSTDVTCMLLYTTTSVWSLVYRRYMYVIIYNHLCMTTGLQTLHVCYYIQPPLYGHWSTDVTCMLLYTPLYGHWSTDVTCMLLYTTTSVWSLVYRRYMYVIIYNHLCMTTGLQTLHVCYYIQPPLYGHWSTDVTCMLLYTTTSVWPLVYRRYMYVIIYTSVWPLVYRRYMYVIIYNHLCMVTGLQTLHVCYYIQPPLYDHWSTDVTCMLLYTPLYGHWSTDVTCMLLYTTTSVWPLVYRRYMYVMIYNHLCMGTGLQTLHVCYYIQPPLYGHWSTDVTCMLLYTTTSVWALVYRRYMYVIIYNHLCMATGLQTLHVCYYIQQRHGGGGGL